MESKDIAIFGGLAGLGFLLYQNKAQIEDALKQISGGFGGGGGLLGGFDLGELKLPEINIPEFSFPKIDLPKIEIPQLDLAGLKNLFPEINIPNPIEETKEAISKVTTPIVERVKETSSIVGDYGQNALMGGVLGGTAGGVLAVAGGTGVIAPLIVAGAGAGITGNYLRKRVIDTTEQTPGQNIKDFWDRIWKGDATTSEKIQFATMPLITIFRESAQRQDDYFPKETKTATAKINLGANNYREGGSGANTDFQAPISGSQTTRMNAISQPIKAPKTASSKDIATAGQKGSNYAKIIRKSGAVEIVKRKRF